MFIKLCKNAKKEGEQSIMHPQMTSNSAVNELYKMEKAATTESWTTGYIFNLRTVVCHVILISRECRNR